MSTKKEPISFKVKDSFGERTLIVPPSELAFSGNPTPGVLKIEAMTRTRLRDGENPIWFLRVHQQFERESNPNDRVSFAEYLQRLHPDKIEVLSPSVITTAVNVEADTKQTEIEPKLNDTEKNIIEALGTDTLTGEKLAKKAGYPYNSNFKSTLSALHRRGILGNKRPGYFVQTDYHFLLAKSGQSQD